MSPSSRAFLVKSDAEGGRISIEVGELAGVVAENLGLATWGAAVVLADILYRWTVKVKETVKGDDTELPILELGAGTGLAGLTAAALWDLPAVLTDLEPVLPGIELNIELNPGLDVKAGTLDWTNPELLLLTGARQSVSAALTTKATVILAADTCYSEDHPGLITSTVKTWLAKRKDAKAFFCYPLRMSYIDHARNLWQKLEEAGLVCLDEGREEANPKELWGEIAPVPYEWSVWCWREFWPDVPLQATGCQGEWLAM